MNIPQFLSATILGCSLSTPLFASDIPAKLIEAAKEEGALTVIAVSHDWCGYGDLIAGFKNKYGIQVNELSPNAGSGEELETIKANKGNRGPQAPDVVDLGLAFGPIGKSMDLLQPYKVQHWDEIPDDLKDQDGYWYADYYGILAFLVNGEIIKSPPASWSDLKKSDFKDSIALPADPRTANNAILSIYAAGLSTGAKSGEEAARAGLRFYKDLKTAGNLTATYGKASSLAQGETPITTRWDFNGVTYHEQFGGKPPIHTVVPKDITVAGVYAQAISKFAPHPNAAKLWMEYLYSDEGQIGFLRGLCHPIRFEAMTSRNELPQDLITKLPQVGSERLVFPAVAELNTAAEVIAAEWSDVMR